MRWTAASRGPRVHPERGESGRLPCPETPPAGSPRHRERARTRTASNYPHAFGADTRFDLYHAALVVQSDGERYTIELAPSPNSDLLSRGVVATGAVGSRLVGRLRWFRYEVRCWRGGSIPDLADAVGGPRRLTDDAAVAGRLLTLVRAVPTPVWGRDELGAGEMWNSNSMIAWVIATAGLATDSVRPPLHGRAPGWDAGLALALGPQPDMTARRRVPARPPTAVGRPVLRQRTR